MQYCSFITSIYKINQLVDLMPTVSIDVMAVG